MVNASGSAGLRIFEHCSFWPQATASIVFDVDISKTVKSTVTTTDDDFNDIGINNQGKNPDFIGFRFSESGDANVEAMRITNSTIFCAGGPHLDNAMGVGIRISDVTFDALRHRYSDNKINLCSEAIHAANGLPDIGSNAFQSNTKCVTATGSPIRIHDNDSENCGQFFVGGGNTAVIIESNRIAACQPSAELGCINLHGSVISRGNSFDNIGGDHIPINSTGGTYLLSEGDAIPDVNTFVAGITDPTHGFYHSEVKLHGQGPYYFTQGGGNAIVYGCDHYENNPWKVNNNTQYICNDSYDDRLKVWQLTGPSRALLPYVQPADPTCDYIGKQWLNTSTSTTAFKICMSVAGALRWVTK
jgi:hypothetical protein